MKLIQLIIAITLLDQRILAINLDNKKIELIQTYLNSMLEEKAELFRKGDNINEKFENGSFKVLNESDCRIENNICLKFYEDNEENHADETDKN